MSRVQGSVEGAKLSISLHVQTPNPRELAPEARNRRNYRPGWKHKDHFVYIATPQRFLINHPE